MSGSLGGWAKNERRTGTYCFCVEAQLSRKKVRAGIAPEMGCPGFFVFQQ